MALVRDDGIEAHILKVRELPLFLGALIAKARLQVEQLFVFLIALLPSGHGLVRVPLRHQMA